MIYCGSVKATDHRKAPGNALAYTETIRTHACSGMCRDPIRSIQHVANMQRMIRVGCCAGGGGGESRACVTEC